jgi:hypothetical protein
LGNAGKSEFFNTIGREPPVLAAAIGDQRFVAGTAPLRGRTRRDSLVVERIQDIRGVDTELRDGVATLQDEDSWQIQLP